MELISHIRCFVRNVLGKQCIVHYYSNQQQSDVMPCGFFADRGSTPNTCYLNTALHSSSHIFSFPALKCNLGKVMELSTFNKFKSQKTLKKNKNWCLKTDGKSPSYQHLSVCVRSRTVIGRWEPGTNSERWFMTVFLLWRKGVIKQGLECGPGTVTGRKWNCAGQ